MTVENKRILYPNGQGGISIIIPPPLWTGSVADLANKDVPAELPYLIVDVDDLPEDRTHRDLWTADFTEPDGYGQSSQPQLNGESNNE